MSDYIEVLRNSDLTLNPAGKNAECYRIYEAMSVGSVPVVEDGAGAASCGTASAADGHRVVLRLLKRHDAPVMYVSDWRRDLPALLRRERRMSPADVVARRLGVVGWYRKFRRKMRDTLVRVVRRKFFDGV